jgi:hypothetical protein
VSAFILIKLTIIIISAGVVQAIALIVIMLENVQDA